MRNAILVTSYIDPHQVVEIIDASRGYNVLVTEDPQELLHSILGVVFDKHIARTIKIVMRKQMAPLLKKTLEVSK